MEAAYKDLHSDLVTECKNGNRKSQYALYKLYSKAMFNIAMRILNKEDEAADVLQEAFIDVFAKIGDFRQETTFGLWLKQIVINRSISQLRKRRVELIDIDDSSVGEIAEEEPIDYQEQEWQVQQVHGGIQALPDGYRVILSLYLLEGYDHEEIAHILKISVNTSRTQFMRAKRKLVEILKNNGFIYN